ncbi:Kinesin light chain isoform 2 [Schistosoma japonicum]|uniref:Kinesin light chain n=2 Tax=Schistosoma japonicum TaxID=6182 RepID=A0A4Z2DBY0_SCHJA|nr:Kinesin light chain isoform 2 [Schistosoma japonicum]
MGMPSHVKQSIKQAQLVLESLKQDHEQALSALSVFCNSSNSYLASNPNTNLECEKVFNQEKIPIIQAALKQIEKGLDDSEVMITFARYIEHLEAELLKVQLHNQRLTEETCWLRDELKYTQAKLEENESLLAQTEVEKKHLEFMLDLKKYDHVSSNSLDNTDNSPFKHSVDDPPMMVTSVLGLMSSPNHMRVSSYVDRFGAHSKFRKPIATATTTSPFSTYDHLEMSGIMNTSLLDADLDSLSVNRNSDTGEFHGLSGHRNSQSTYIPPGLRTLHHIVLRYTSQGKHDVASSLCLQAIRDLEESSGHDQVEVAALLNILALVYRDQGKYKDASEILKEVLSIREKILGPNHVLVAAALNNLAVLHAKAGRFTEAEPLCRRALSIREKVLGGDHLDVAKQLNNLALLCQSQGKFDEVESAFRRALDIYAKHHKPSSPIIRKAKSNLASALLKRRNLTDAESLLKSVLTPDRSYALQSQKSHLNNNNNSNLSQSESVEHDSAIYSLSSLGSSRMMSSSGYRGVSVGDVVLPYDSTEQSMMIMNSSSRPVSPLWVILEQSLKDNNSNRKFSLVTWASEARIELSVVHSAARNLAIVYQRQGLQSHANLLLEWLQMAITDSRLRLNHHHTSALMTSSPLAPTQSASDTNSRLLTS